LRKRLTFSFLARFAARFLSRLTAASLRARTSAFLSRFTATSRRARNSWFLCAFRSRIRSFLARFRCRIVAAVVDVRWAALACAVAAFRFTRGCVYDRCRFGAAETLRCALVVMLLPVLAGRTA